MQPSRGAARSVDGLVEYSGVAHLAAPWFFVVSTPLPADGVATLPLVAPAVPGAPLDEARTFHLQAAHVTPGLLLRLGSPTAWTLLHSSF